MGSAEQALTDLRDPGSCRAGDSIPTAGEPTGSESPWREVGHAFAFLWQFRQVGGLLANAGILPDERAAVAGITAALRAAIDYLLYTRTQPLTLSQLADDLGAPPRLTALALTMLCEEGALIRKGGLYWVPDDGKPPPTPMDWTLTRLRSQITEGVHPQGQPISATAVGVTLGIGKYRTLEFFGILRREGLIQADNLAWILTPKAMRLAGPPRLPLPATPPVPYPLAEILDTVKRLNHSRPRPTAPAWSGSGPWHRTRAMAAQILAGLPAAEDEEQEFAFRVLAEISAALAPYEPSARAWHTACLATAIQSVLDVFPHDALPGVAR